MALTNLSQITTSGIATGTDLNIRNITGVAATFTGNVTVGGTLTYDDVTNIDSVGLITARSGISVTGGDVNLTSGNLALASATPMVVASNGSGHLRLGAGGSEKVRITSGGNVGINSTSPREKLDVIGNANIIVDNNKGIKLGYRGESKTAYIGLDANDAPNAGTQSWANSAYIGFYSDGSSERSIKYRSNAGSHIFQGTNGNEYVRITGIGSVGIGLANPSKKLTVNGDILVTDENKIFLNSSADVALNDRKVFGNATWHYLWTEDFDGPPAPYTITQSSNDYSDFTNTNLALTYVSGTQPSGTVNAYVTVASNTITILAIRATGARDYDDTTVFEIPTSTIGSGSQNLQFKILNSNFTRPETQFLSLGGDTEPTNYTYTPNLLKIGNNNFQNLSSVSSLNTLMSVGHNSFNGTLPSAINSAAFGTNIAQHARTINYCAFVGNLHGAFGQTLNTSVGVGYQFSMRRNANWDVGIGHETVGESAPRGSTEITYTITAQPTSMPADGTYQYVNFNDKSGNKTFTYQTNIDVSGGAITSVSLGFAFQPKDLPAVNDVMSTVNANFAGMELTVNSVTEIGGGYNVGVGGYTLRYIDGASGNTAIGHAALNNIGTGSYNISLGHNSGNSITTGSYNVVIGSNSGSGIATSSNNIILSDGQGNIRQFIDSSGNIGIGTQNPTDILDVNKNSSTAYDSTDDDAQRTDGASITVRNDNGSTNTFSQLVFDTAGSNQSIARIVALRTGSASNALTFVTEDNNTKAERLRITSAGNVGIGTDDPDVYSLGGNNRYAAIKASTGYAVLNLVDSNNSGSYLQFGNPTVRRGSLHFESNSDFVITSNASNSGTSLTERLRVRSDGRVTIGTQTINTNSMLSIHRSSSDESQIRFTNTTTGEGGNNGLLVGIDSNEHGRIFNQENTPLRFGTNNTERLRITSGGQLLVSGLASLTSTSLSHPIQIAADSSAQNIACFGRASDDISAIDFYEADKTTNLGEIQYRQDHVNFRHRVGDIRFATGGVTERLRIRSDGKISAGTLLDTSNSYEFSIRGADGTGCLYAHGRNHYLSTRSTSHASLTLKKSNSDSDGIDYLQLRDSSNTGKFIVNGDGTLQIVDSIKHMGDTDTLISFPANDTITLHTNGSERLRITSGGLVDISGGIQVSENVTPTSGAGLELFREGGGGGQIQAYDRGGSAWLPLILKSSQTQIFASGTERLRIHSDGKLMTQSAGYVYTASSAGSLSLYGGNTNLGGGIILGGGNSNADIRFLAQASTATPAERMRIKADGSLLHKGNNSNTIDNTDGDGGASGGYPASGATFNKNVSVNNNAGGFGQSMNMISHTKSITLNGSTNHDMVSIYNREGCFIGHVYAGYSASGDGAVAMYKFNTFYSANSIIAELGPSSRSSDTISVSISSSGDTHTFRVNGNGYSGDVTIGLVFLSAGTTPGAHYGVRYY